MKPILKTLMIISLYELSKEITYEIICRMQANRAKLNAYNMGGF